MRLKCSCVCVENKQNMLLTLYLIEAHLFVTQDNLNFNCAALKTHHDSLIIVVSYFVSDFVVYTALIFFISCLSTLQVLGGCVWMT